MGRPLKKDVLGRDVLNTPVSNTGIRATFHDGTALRTDGMILKQRGAKTFVVARIGTPAARVTSTLVSGTPSAVGQLRLVGFPTAGNNSDATAIAIAKITKRVATDFAGNRYTWRLENDSSADYIVLTAI